MGVKYFTDMMTEVNVNLKVLALGRRGGRALVSVTIKKTFALPSEEILCGKWIEAIDNLETECSYTDNIWEIVAEGMETRIIY